MLPGMKHRQTTVRSIAADTGLSIATVSRALNNHANVSPDTRRRIHEAAERLSRPAPAARAGAVFVRCPYVLTDYFGLIVSSIAETLELHGRGLLLNAGEGGQHAAVLPGLAHRSDVAGVIAVLPPEPATELDALRGTGLPLVVVDPRTPPPRAMVAVSASHFAGARDLTAHLVRLGHRRIGVLSGPRNWLATTARLAGHHSALADAGVLPAAPLVRHGEPTIDYGHRAAAELLALPQRPTALVAFNDKAAVGALKAAHEHDLRVPEDLSIAGFDDIDLARATQPMLTTVRQPLQEMGRMAVTLLMRLIDRHRLDALHVELATQLVPRESTGPAPGPDPAGPTTAT
jgi:LacI family transcriptional regulator